MGERKINVLIVTVDDYVAEDLERQLNTIFHPNLNTSIWYRGAASIPSGTYDLAICTTKGIYQEAKNKGVLNRANDAIVITRHLNSSAFEHIDQIFSIPPYTRVLVCANTIEAARINLSRLQKWGVTHLTMVPYANNLGIQTDSYEYAIVFGYMDKYPTCPRDIKTVIDLGSWEFDFQSIVEIIQKGKIFSRQAFVNNQKFIKNIMGLSSKLAKARDENLFLNEQLKAVLQHTADDIIMLDKELQIVHANGKLLRTAALNQTNRLETVAPELYHTVNDMIQKKKHHAITVLIENEYYLAEVNQIFVRNMIVGYVVVLNKAKRIQKLELNARRAISEKPFEAKYTFDQILTKSAEMEDLISFAKIAAQTENSIVIYGETGSGKEMLAQSIHNYSMRAENAFVPVNVSAIQDSLIESELFGYEDGAFTGARKGGKPGLFELADKGTLFLDEIGELSLPLQAKLLRVIQEKEVVRIGGTRVIPIDIRLITATNQDLYALVRNGKFRQDLYYRINVLSIHAIPLRQRKADIELLLTYFFHMHGIDTTSLPEEVRTLLLNYDWPGNVREIQSTCDYIACIMPLYLRDLATFKRQLCEYLHIEEKTAKIPHTGNCLHDINSYLDVEICGIILGELIQAKREKKKISLVNIYHANRGLGGVSINKIRRQAALLSEAGLIYIGHTKQGTQITEYGEKCWMEQIKTDNN